MTHPPHPVLVFDGECRFCQRWVARLKKVTADRVEYLPFQDAARPARFPSLNADACEHAVHFIRTDGSVTQAAAAVFQCLADGADCRWPVWMYQRLPGVRWACERAYRFVSAHRRLF